MTPISSVKFSTDSLRPIEGAAPRWETIAQAVGVLAAASLAYFVAGWIAFFAVGAAGIALMIASRGTRPEGALLEDLPQLRNSGVYIKLDLVTKWFFTGNSILRNAVRYQLAKLPEADRPAYLERLKQMEARAVLDCYTMASKILVLYPRLIMTQEKPEYQQFFRRYHQPDAQQGFQDRSTFHDLLHISNDINNHEIFPADAVPLTSEEKERFLDLDAHDAIDNTAAFQAATPRVQRLLRWTAEAAQMLGHPDHTLNQELRRIVES